MANYENPVLHGIDSDGNKIPVKVFADGTVATSGGGGGGGSTDVSTLLKEGTPIMGETLESGGASGIGWLSSIRKLIGDRIPSGLITNIWNLLNSGNQRSLVRNVSNKFRDDFDGTILKSAVWTTVQTGAGQTATVGNSELTIAAGTTANAETIIRSLVSFTIPMRVMFTAYLSQRIANQEFYLEIVDSTGANVARIQFTGTTSTVANFQTVNNSNSLSPTSIGSLSSNTSSYQIFELDLGIDLAEAYTRIINSTSIRGSGATKTQFVPDPNQQYFLQIRARNLGTAPASNTNLIIDSISVQDIEEFTAEIAGGRGGGNPSAAIPVVLVVSPTINSISTAVTTIATTGSSLMGDVGIQYRGNSTGACIPHAVVSTATTNASVVKGSSGRVLGFLISNTSPNWRYLKFHNTNSTPVAGTSTVFAPIALPPSKEVEISFDGGFGFTSGISFTIVAGAANSDSTAIGVNEIVGTIFYI